jgi:hypothetical protein
VGAIVGSVVGWSVGELVGLRVGDLVGVAVGGGGLAALHTALVMDPIAASRALKPPLMVIAFSLAGEDT